jgi:hypothetical protein
VATEPEEVEEEEEEEEEDETTSPEGQSPTPRDVTQRIKYDTCSFYRITMLNQKNMNHF